MNDVCDWLYCNINFIVVIWNHTCNISKVCLYEHLKNQYIFVWLFQWMVQQLCQLLCFQGPGV